MVLASTYEHASSAFIFASTSSDQICLASSEHFKLAYLKDSNAAAHSVDSDIFQSSDSSICALQDLTLTFIS